MTYGVIARGRSGYAVLRLKSKQEAIEQGRKFMQAHIDVLGPSYEGELEIRQMADMGPDQNVES
jgi:hypothetical protein